MKPHNPSAAPSTSTANRGGGAPSPSTRSAGATPSAAPSSAAAASPNPNPKSSPSAAAAAAAAPNPIIPTIPPPPVYGFHNLDRRTIMLADGNIRSYFSLPPSYSFEPIIHPFESLIPQLNPILHFRPPPAPLKRKLDHDDHLAWHRHNVLQYGNSNTDGNDGNSTRARIENVLQYGNAEDLRAHKQIRIRGDGNGNNSNGVASDLRAGKQSKVGVDAKEVAVVDEVALKKAFLEYVKKINENLPQKINYIEDGKNGKLQCIACSDRTARDFRDVHGLLKHAFNCQIAEFRVNHLGLHKALCVLLGLNYLKNPDNKANIILSNDEAQANRKDLIMWPPSVIIHNTSTTRRLDGQTEGNKEVEAKLKELGFGSGNAKSIYRKDGYTGVVVVKFAATLDGLKEAERLNEYFEKDNHGRSGWAAVQASHSGDEDKNPALVNIDEKTGEKKRIFYGYLATAFDLDKVDVDIKKRCVIKSRKELDMSG